ncbi:MAG TPA: methyltransferase [Burkholderiales bacterium]|nr:methyltransferase [Burkholderiales bacterium]
MNCMKILTALLLPLALACGVSSAQAQSAESVEALLDKALAGDHRSAANRARDKYRHPRETLLFFGLKPEMTVLEIWPGSGWYSEIIAPVLAQNGKFYLAHYAVENPRTVNWQREARSKLESDYAKRPALYGKPIFTSLGPPDYLAIAPAGSLDLLLTFRNVHNWSLQKTDMLVFKTFFDALKPGGILGVVEHRANAGTSFEQMVKTGYMTEAYVIELAQKAGFKLLAKSEVNANPKDTKDHPNGVWTLPPTSRGRLDPEKYSAIGESDRMTLKFEKPAQNTVAR